MHSSCGRLARTVHFLTFVTMHSGIQLQCDHEALVLGVMLKEACLAGVMWTMKFSKNGHHLASAGQDAVIRVWEIVAARGGPPPPPPKEGAPADENGHAGVSLPSIQAFQWRTGGVWLSDGGAQS